MKGRKLELVGRVFGRLAVIREAKSVGRGTRWLCRCECGTEKTISSVGLIHGNTRSCGCLARDRSAERGRARQKPFESLLRRNARTGCLEWQGARDIGGYGRYKHRGREQKAHRIAYARAHGSIPDGLWVLHRCDNPPCCEPSHLFIGDVSANGADAVSKGRQAHGERHGRSKLTESDVRIIRRLLAEDVSQERIATVFGIDQTQVSRIKLRQLWSHVKDS